MKLQTPRNMTLKGLALALATLLWVHVATDKSYEVEATLPVTDVSLGEGLALAEAPPDSITALITATGKDLLRSAWRNAGIALRLNDERAGVRMVDLDLSVVSLVSGEGISFSNVISPRAYRFNFDRKDSRTVEVLPRVTITPAVGFASSQEQQVTPSEVFASGPAGALEKLRKAYTEPRTLTAVRSDFDLPLKLVADGLYGVSFEPPEVSYRVSVTAVKERLIDSLPIALLNAPSYDCDLQPAFVSVLVSGGADLIDALDANQISVTADFDDLTDQNQSKIQLSMPSKLELKSLSDSLTLVVRRN